MVFSSLIFLYLFLPACLLLYYLAPGLKWKNAVLILVSLFFYAWGEPVWVLLLLFFSLFGYLMGRLIGSFGAAGRKKASKRAMIVGVTVDVALLVFFKYTGFFLENIGLLTGAHMPGFTIALPLGISFFTFQSISYLVDVYWGKAAYQKSFFDFLVFKAMFPPLIAGPILRYVDLAADIMGRTHTVEKFARGVARFCVGLGKKVILANYAGAVVTRLIGGSALPDTVLGGWVGILLFAFQIYFDFSGYTDMAIGLGSMFGFTYKENFNYPYTSVSITDFWRRWHMSLSHFFRDYVYIPLGGNRRHQVFNILVVWTLTGFWHGASWNFILWGLYFALLLVVEKLFLRKLLERLPAFLSRVYALFFVLLGWIFFYFTSVEKIGSFFSLLFGFSGAPLSNAESLTTLTNNSLLLVVCVIASTPIARLTGALLKNGASRSRFGAWFAGSATLVFDLLLLLVSTALLVGNSYNPFLYFRF